MKSGTFILPALCVVLTSCLAGGLTISAWDRLPQNLLDDTAPSIWGVFDKCGGTLGTAFVVEHEGKKRLVTSLHVIRGFRLDEPLDDQLKISRSEVRGKMDEETTETLEQLKVVHVDDVRDIVVLDAQGLQKLPALALSDFEDRRIRVFAVGLAQAVDYFGMSITEGIISNPDKEVVKGSRAFRQTHIEHTAFLVGGQSGGPLIDMYGEVVGVDSFAKGQRGLNLFYATPLRRALDSLSTEGGLEIANRGVARIKEIYVTPKGEEPAEIDKLPPEIGMINGMSAIRFGLAPGEYRVELVTEEDEPDVNTVVIEAGELTGIDYAHKKYGLRIVNNGCRRILLLSLLSPMAQSFLELTLADEKLSEEVKKERVLKLMMTQNILGKPGEVDLAPGQTWVEWVVPGRYKLYSFTWDPEIGEFRMPDARELKVTKRGLTKVFLMD